MHIDHGGGVPDSTTFAQTLSDLKRRGSNLLLVGDVNADAHEAVCRRLLGDPAEEPRRRLFVFPPDAEGCSHFPPDAADGPTWVVRHIDADVAVGDEVAGDVVVDSDLLSALGTTFLDTIEDVESAAGELEPSELRLCFDSVGPLLRNRRSETAFRLLHMITSRVRQADGMGHFHLRVGYDNDYVSLLEPLYDAVVELRVEDDTVQQRWHLRDSDVTSDWLDL